MCKVLILLFIITFIKNPENAPNLLALDHHLPLISIFTTVFECIDFTDPLSFTHLLKIL